VVRYNAIEDPLCYAGSNVLINEAGIQNQDDLDQFEQLMFQTRADEELPQGNFDLKHYQSLHHHFFQDVYEWAGKLRVIRTSKGNNTFCYPEHIETEMNRIFKELAAENYLQDIENKSDFSDRATYYLSEINAVHPFREGNGRIQLTFLTLLAFNCGYNLNENRIDEIAFLNAMITSFNGELIELKKQIEAMI